jgi:hypothetical protein
MAKSGGGSVAGSSATLNKIITEIMTFLKDNGPRPGGSGADLQAFLDEKIGDLVVYWFNRGFRRGVIESRKVGIVPSTVRYIHRRAFFKGQKREVRVTSKLKRRARPKAARP